MGTFPFFTSTLCARPLQQASFSPAQPDPAQPGTPCAPYWYLTQTSTTSIPRLRSLGCHCSLLHHISHTHTRTHLILPLFKLDCCSSSFLRCIIPARHRGQRDYHAYCTSRSVHVGLTASHPSPEPAFALPCVALRFLSLSCQVPPAIAVRACLALASPDALSTCLTSLQLLPPLAKWLFIPSTGGCHTPPIRVGVWTAQTCLACFKHSAYDSSRRSLVPATTAGILLGDTASRCNRSPIAQSNPGLMLLRWRSNHCRSYLLLFRGLPFTSLSGTLPCLSVRGPPPLSCMPSAQIHLRRWAGLLFPTPHHHRRNSPPRIYALPRPRLPPTVLPPFLLATPLTVFPFALIIIFVHRCQNERSKLDISNHGNSG